MKDYTVKEYRPEDTDKCESWFKTKVLPELEAKGWELEQSTSGWGYLSRAEADGLDPYVELDQVLKSRGFCRGVIPPGVIRYDYGGQSKDIGAETATDATTPPESG